MKTIFQQMAESAKIDNIDEALYPLQTLLGVTTGDVASVFFSDTREGNFQNEESWPGMTPDQRLQTLCKYVAHEMLYIDGYISEGEDS